MERLIFYPHLIKSLLLAQMQTMTIDTVFQVANTTALLGWVLLIALPKAKITRIIISSGLLILLFALVYSVMIFSQFNLSMMNDFSSLQGVMKLFSDPAGVTVGWIHYLAFDLFVGIWITKEGLKIGVNRLLLFPCQLGSFMFGPVGLLLFYVLRMVHNKSISPELIELD